MTYLLPNYSIVVRSTPCQTHQSDVSCGILLDNIQRQHCGVTTSVIEGEVTPTTSCAPQSVVAMLLKSPVLEACSANNLNHRVVNNRCQYKEKYLLRFTGYGPSDDI